MSRLESRIRKIETAHNALLDRPLTTADLILADGSAEKNPVHAERVWHHLANDPRNRGLLEFVRRANTTGFGKGNRIARLMAHAEREGCHGHKHGQSL